MLTFPISKIFFLKKLSYVMYINTVYWVEQSDLLFLKWFWTRTKVVLVMDFYNHLYNYGQNWCKCLWIFLVIGEKFQSLVPQKTSVINILEEQGITNRYLYILYEIYDNSTGQIKLHGITNKYSLSPNLFLARWRICLGN